MSKFVPGIILKQIRMEKKIKAIQVYKGVCDQTTYSRIEQGKQVPSIFIFKLLMERLGSDYRRFYIDIQSVEDYEQYNKKENICQLLRATQFDEAKKALNEFITEFDKPEETTGIGDISSRLRKQFILSSKAVIASYMDRDYDSILRTLWEAISITVIDFDENEVCCNLLSLDEIEIVNMIANTYNRQENYERAIALYYQIKNNMDMYYADEMEKAIIYPIVLYNLTKSLGSVKKYDEVIEICDTAAKYCCRYNNHRPLPQILYNKSYGLYYKGDKEGCLTLSIEAYYCARAHGDFRTANVIQERTKERLGIDVSKQ